MPALETHFSHLATPTQKETFTTERQSLASINVRNLQARSSINEIKITKHEVKYAIKNLKKKKACDIYGLGAEHLAIAAGVVTDFLTPIINKIVD